MACLHQKLVLSVNADSTECCPLENLKHLLAVGTYELDEKTSARRGLLCIYYLEQDSVNGFDQFAGSSHVPRWKMHKAQTCTIPGIFDMKWQPVTPARLVAACADGSLHVLQVQQADSACQIIKQQAVQTSDKGMAVSLDVTSSGHKIISSSSDGSLSALQVLTMYPYQMQPFVHARISMPTMLLACICLL